MILALAEQFKQLPHMCNLKGFRCLNKIRTHELCGSVLSHGAAMKPLRSQQVDLLGACVA